ncbi:vitamin D 25-hydroxylase [Rhipicephalus sanguineus]|uniref:vitamin D 25-hydroxylase n=1 Tax=Rhipicephalus sanguineus TaxID=34632 RepID=UPI0020C27589|nr:vitamin D 25-hydroxylase [Rhipicephalus sanguineus]
MAAIMFGKRFEQQNVSGHVTLNDVIEIVDLVPALSAKPRAANLFPWLRKLMCFLGLGISAKPKEVLARRDRFTDATEYLRISGYTNPCGTIVISSLWSIYDASFWGDPDVFSPERFLDDGGTSAKKPERLILFSYGKGSCPGEAVANMVLFIYFTTILLHFVVEARPDDPAHECVESLGLSLRPSLRGLIFRPRRSDSFSDTMHDI